MSLEQRLSDANKLASEPVRHDVVAFGFVLAVLLMLAVIVCGQREFLLPNAETDFAGGFVPEAEHLLRGEKLEVRYHLPGYAAALAGVQALVGDWFASGLLLSVVSATLVLVSVFRLFGELCGRLAAWGAVVACLASTPFVLHALLASSDMWFTACYWLTMLFLVRAIATGSNASWFASGVLAGLTIFARSNGITVVAAVLVPLALYVPTRNREHLRHAATMIAGVLVPVVAWLAYASATGSPTSTTAGYVNLAIALHSDGPGGLFEETAQMLERFESTADVLAYDPAAAARRAARNLLGLPRDLLFDLTSPVLAILGTLGFIGIVLRARRSPTPAAIAVLVLLSVLPLGITPYHSRFFVFVCPAFGAAAGWLFHAAMQSSLLRTRATLRWMTVTAVATSMGIALVASVRGAGSELSDPMQQEIASAVPAVREHVPSDRLLVARKGLLAFHAGHSKYLALPTTTTLEGLRARLCVTAKQESDVYVFLGMEERKRRLELVMDAKHSNVPWLEVVATNTAPEWELYRLQLNCDRI